MNEIRGVEEVLKTLEYWFGRVRATIDERQQAGFSGLRPAQIDEEQERLAKQAENFRKQCRTELEELLDFPPRHLRHQPHLEQFWAEGNYEQSVFIMTKFPENPVAEERDAQLTRVIDAVRKAIKDAGLIPRIANRDYHEQLWDNVELHMLCCKQGIAIVEDRYLPELNPNVAMEWGWMRGMSKRVLYLVEEGFTRQRADFIGLINKPFSWDDPEPGIVEAVSAFLKQP